MPESNILDLLTPPQPRNLPPQDCLGCNIVQSLLSFGGGLYMNLNSIFKDAEGRIDPKKHPLWWRNTVKSTGILLIGLGAYRAGEAVQIVWARKFE